LDDKHEPLHLTTGWDGVLRTFLPRLLPYHDPLALSLSSS
jgi:hypothetical protein